MFRIWLFLFFALAASEPVPEILEEFKNEAEYEFLEKNEALVAFAAKSNGNFTILGFGTFVSNSDILVTGQQAFVLAQIPFMLINKNFAENLTVESSTAYSHPLTDRSHWNDLGFIRLNITIQAKIKYLPILKRDKTKKLTLGNDKQVLLKPSECKKYFEDRHCCEYEENLQVCIERTNKTGISLGMPLLGKCQNKPVIVGVLAGGNEFFHGKNIYVFTRINKFCDWLKMTANVNCVS